jgi:uncharacterized protein
MPNSLNTTGLSSQCIEKIKAIFSQFPQVKKVLLYGSRAKGNYNNGSDIDLSIMNKEVDFSDLIKIESALDNILLPYKIDLNLFSKIKNTELKEHIQREGIKF